MIVSDKKCLVCGKAFAFNDYAYYQWFDLSADSVTGDTSILACQTKACWNKLMAAARRVNDPPAPAAPPPCGAALSDEQAASVLEAVAALADALGAAIGRA